MKKGKKRWSRSWENSTCVDMSHNEEAPAPRDPGVSLTTHPSFTDQDFEGHRAHTVYVGLHVPGYRRRGHRRHRHHHHKNGHKKKEDGTAADYEHGINRPVTPPAERVHFILGEGEDDTHESHPLFSEMEELQGDGDDMEWRETARWVKFEEDVEEGGNRWSKPHVATISLHSLFELRSCILNGTVMLDMDASSLDQISDLMLESMVNSNQLQGDMREKVKEALLRRHRHQHEKRHGGEKGSRLPLIRSLADIGRNSSKSVFGSNTHLDKEGGGHSIPSTPNSPSAHGEGKPNFGKFLNIPDSGQNHQESGIPQSPSSTSLHGHNTQPCLTTTGSTLTENTGASSADLQHKLNQAFMKKIPPGSEASNILVGDVDFLDRAIMAFVRLKQGIHLGDLTEVPVPTRFLFILLGPSGNLPRYHEIGRAMATLLSDEVFHDVAYKARNRQDLLAGVDEFLDAVTVLPPGAWDPSIRIEPPSHVPSQEGRKKHKEPDKEPHIEPEEEEEKLREESGLKRTGRIFGGLINDIKRRKQWYLSDFKDALALQTVASVFFLYFACLAPIITFGGLLGEATGSRLAAMESLLSGAINGILYGLFSGQPLNILGSTGPVLVFETIVYSFCRDHGLEYLPLRLWIGLWTSAILMVLVSLDASALVCYITRFTEENFATLISMIFIYKAIEKVLHINHDYPFETHTTSLVNQSCYCAPSENSSIIGQPLVNWSSLSTDECGYYNGTLEGDGCTPHKYVPDVFLFSIILFLGTFTLSVILKDFKFTSFFPSKIRAVISDFAVVISILIMTVTDLCVGIETPKLEVPHKFKPTWEGRAWLIPWFGSNPWWTSLAAVVPALLATILIFMDQQITAVIVNRKENKLKKGCGYHLDLFLLSIQIAICSILGLPWFVAATVLAMTHVNSLKMESETAAPGEKPQFLGVREQRVTHILIFILVGLSVFFTTVLKFIPMPVLFGVFLYMGVSALKGLQLFDRILILFMPQKYQPDLMFLRSVETLRVHLFTVVQLACLVTLWVIKSYKPTSIAFPLMLVVMIGIRKLLDFVFTQRELKILDDVIPESAKKKLEEEMRKLEEEQDTSTEKEGRMLPNASAGNVAIPLANGNVLKIPVTKFKEENEQLNSDQSNINISEQLNKTGLWQSLQQKEHSTPKIQHKNSPPSLKIPSSLKKKRGNKNDAINDEEKKRLSTMAEDEEEDDCGITIKIQEPTPVPSNSPSKETSPDDTASREQVNHSETRV
ncbi:sodium-driven chloride bicarbonate exchanger-like isoform X3 [Tachypleus tridentatus]|uniref:sodium-driven chloride bicarbonate exchanger-like isoform X3 n=1 Tax=Tachypleus tridentatus TaxID=6853 RepID=UPI003FD317F4